MKLTPSGRVSVGLTETLSISVTVAIPGEQEALTYLIDDDQAENLMQAMIEAVHLRRKIMHDKHGILDFQKYRTWMHEVHEIAGRDLSVREMPVEFAAPAFLAGKTPEEAGAAYRDHLVTLRQKRGIIS